MQVDVYFLSRRCAHPASCSCCGTHLHPLDTPKCVVPCVTRLTVSPPAGEPALYRAAASRRYEKSSLPNRRTQNREQKVTWHSPTSSARRHLDRIWTRSPPLLMSQEQQQLNSGTMPHGIHITRRPTHRQTRTTPRIPGAVPTSSQVGQMPLSIGGYEKGHHRAQTARDPTQRPWYLMEQFHLSMLRARSNTSVSGGER